MTDIPHKLCNIGKFKLSGNPDYDPIMQACPCIGSSGEPGHPLFDFAVLMMGKASVGGAQALTQGSRLVLTEWGNTPTRHTSTEKYTKENIYARCQSPVRVTSMVVMLHVIDRGPDSGQIPGSAFIKPDQLDPGIRDQIKITLLPTISHLQLLNFVSCRFGNCRCKIVDSRVFPIWSLIHGSSWSGLIKAEPGHECPTKQSGHITNS